VRVGMIQNFWCHVDFGSHKGGELWERTKSVMGVVPAGETKVDDTNLRKTLLVLGVGFRFEEKIFELKDTKERNHFLEYRP